MNGDFMKTPLLLLIFLSAIFMGCGKKTFESNLSDSQTPIPVDPGIVIDPPVDGNECPRYDLVVDSSHQSVAHRNYRFVFNSEMKKTSTQGVINVHYLQDSSTVHFTRCSGNYQNTMVMVSLKPLDVTEELTRQMVIDHNQSCPAVAPQQLETIRVLDGVTGRVLFDEQTFRQSAGACQFGYTALGRQLRSQLIQLATGVVDLKAAACHQ